MEREYSARADGAGNVMVSRMLRQVPQETKWYSISPRDLFAVLQAFEAVGVFDKQKIPGHITRLFFSGEDIATLEEYAKTKEGQEDVAD
jgi:hypothetical protein